MPRTAIGLAGAWIVAGVLFSAGSAQAQDVRWRQDYAAARKEATATGKPLLLDFGTEACVWCRKQDATTFRDRGIVAFLNERFIPVKVDGERDARLTQAAGVQAFPTIVIISPDGKVLSRHEGYADVGKMAALLRQAAPKEPPAPPTVVPVSAVAARSPAADQLAQARTDHDSGRYLVCIERCDRVMTGYPGSAEATEARRLAGTILNDPTKWKKVTTQLEADLAAVKRDLDAAVGK